jgi:hypothetical protein
MTNRRGDVADKEKAMRKASRWATVAVVALATCSPKLLLWYYDFLYLWGGRH